MKLAIFSSQIGFPSETFVRRHIEDLAPGNTCVVCERKVAPNKRAWDFEGPTFVTDERSALTGYNRIAAGVLRRLGSERPNVHHKLEKFLEEQQVEVALFEFLGAGLTYLPTFQKLGIRIFAHAFGWDVYHHLNEPELLELYQKSYRGIDGMIVMSEHMRKRTELANLRPKSFLVKRCGTDIPDSPRDLSKGTGKVVVAIGRMVSKKSPIHLLDSFRRAFETEPTLHLHYVGDGPLLPAARDFIAAFNLGENVTLHGILPHDQTQAILDTADIFVQHSIEDPVTGDCEGMPVIIGEAMARGIPVVSTLHSGIPETVTNGESGLLVNERDGEAMAAAVVKLATNPNLRSRIGKAGRAAAEKNLSIESELKKLRQFMSLPSTS